MQIQVQRHLLVGSASFDLLTAQQRRALEQCCRQEEAAGMLYAAHITFYDRVARTAALSQKIFSSRLQAQAHSEVSGFLRALKVVTDRYRALSEAELSLALGCFVNPEIDSEAARQCGAVINEDRLQDLMADLQQLRARLDLRKGPKRGSPPLPDLSRLAIPVCMLWEELTGRPPTWNDRGNGGLFEFHTLASETFDVEYVIDLAAADESQLAPIQVRYSSLNSAAGRALRDAARMLADPK